MSTSPVGISGFAAYVPPYRVCLEAWSDWTGNNWQKINAVVGSGFRVRGPEQSVYTLAANAVLRLIQNHDLDASRVAFLALGTESSTDNATGAVIVKGMVNQALDSLGLPLLPRDCEVPEFKHACLGGIYAMKSALRLLASDGADRQAIVVSADIAEYERGSSGEQTQGAGAVAMLLEANPKLLTIDLRQSGSASDYRTNDFRKPFSRFSGQQPGANGQLQDFPLFNGGYSTDCYLEATVEAVRNMLDKRGARHGYLESLPAVFMHRPYKRMPETGLALCTLFALGSGDGEARAELARYCELAGVRPEDVLAEIWSSPRISNDGDRGAGPVYPHTQNVLRAFRGTDEYSTRILAKQALGADFVAELGNLYTASLPAWLAAGLEDAATRGVPLADEEVLMIGYGSGDAAEAIPARLVPGWEDYAIRSGVADSLRHCIPLDQQGYEAFHSGQCIRPERQVGNEFIISRVGTSTDANAADLGIEYYEYVA